MNVTFIREKVGTLIYSNKRRTKCNRLFTIRRSVKSVVMLNVIELFSGIGGVHYSLKGSGLDFRVVAAVDINTSANEVYKHNFPQTKIYQRNVQSFSKDEIDKLNADMITMSPPCQPFTRLGLKKDDSDGRTDALIYIINVLPKLSSTLKYIVLENVQGFETSNSRNKLVETLENCGFTFQEFLLNPSDYYIPSSRLRYYLIAKRKPLKFKFPKVGLITKVPIAEGRLQLLLQEKHPFLMDRSFFEENSVQPPPISTVLENGDLLEYQVPKKTLEKYASLFDVTFPFSRRSCCFTKAYGRYAEGTGSVLCPVSTEVAELALKRMDSFRESASDKVGVNQGLAEVLSKLNVRYFTPREISRLMCFPSEFSWPDKYSAQQLYRLLGNSINVYVMTLIITLMTEGDR